jgi:hypothetical protein
MRSLIAIGLLWFALPGVVLAERPRWTMLVDIDNRQVEGTPLAWSSSRVMLLARDGRLWDFSPKESRNFRKVNSRFSSYSAAEMRAGLERELRGRLVVTGTGHYLVAHPPGKEAWAQRFEDLYRSCTNYFTLREMHVHEPTFPLVAIVWNNQQDFLRYSISQGSNVSSNVLGFYSPSSNRVALFDSEQGARRRGFSENDATIIHEATHQMAFNTGVHNRFSTTPKWLAEGLGTMFEARGVWNWRSYPDRRDRVNRGQLAQFQAWKKHGRTKGTFAELLASDRMFQTNTSAAYAEGWAWVFFLTETHPQKFAEYVRRVAARGDFENYSMQHRIADFSGIFGSDLRMLEKHCLNFIDDLD